MTYPEGVGVREEDRASAPQRLRWLTVGDSGEGLGDAERRLVLRGFAGTQVLQTREGLIGGARATPQSREPGTEADEVLDVGQPVMVQRPGELGPSSIPVTELDQRIGDVQDRGGQVVPGSGPTQVRGGGP